jgi:hypothetical protein
MEHFDTMPEGMRPSQKWWLVITALSRILREVNFVVRRLQGLTTFLPDKNKQLAALASTLQGFWTASASGSGKYIPVGNNRTKRRNGFCTVWSGLRHKN